MSMMFPMLSALALLAVSPAGDQDVVVATARTDGGSVVIPSGSVEFVSPSSTVASATQSLTTAQQIDRWLEDRKPVEEALEWREEAPRRTTGEVTLGIGSGDYTHASARVTMPIGENATLNLGFSQTKNGWYERPMGVDGLFWSPQDEWLGPQWVTPAGRSYTPLGHGRSLIDREADAKRERAPRD